MQLLISIPDRASPQAQGVYEYARNGEPAGVREAWRVDALPGGALLVQVERDARVFGTTILLAALCDAPLAALSFRRVEILLTNEQGSGMRAVYEFAGPSVAVTRTLDAGAPQHETIALPDGVVISPLMRLFLGPTIRRVAERGQGGPVPVLVPYLENPQDTDRLLRPTFDARRACLQGEEAIPLHGRTINAERWQYIGERYDEQSEFWLDADDLLLRYRFQQSADTVWQVELAA
jgi:hypothetical protein